MASDNELSLRQMYPSRRVNMPIGKTFVGIDFGTSTTVVSIASFDQNWNLHCESLKLAQKLEDGTIFESERIPTVIAHHRGNILVGEGAARLKYHLKWGRDIWYYFKMELGIDYGARYPESSLADKEPFRILNPKDAGRAFFMYLNILINRYCQEHQLSQNIEYAVSIPASFEANQRKDLCEALEANSMRLKQQSLIDEPNAAFLSYVQESTHGEKPLPISDLYNPKILVFDFGGGTCDISIIEIGKSYDGVYSKNISISKFEQLGGDDIDRFITYQYLLAAFLANNNKKITDFRTKELEEIARRLYKAAEQLKIIINKRLASAMSGFTVPALKDSPDPVSIESPVRIRTSRGELKQDTFGLAPAQLTEAMRIFTAASKFPKKLDGQNAYNNISISIESAIKKARVKKSEIDYALLIGGSAQSPYIQEAVHNILNESEILVPRDLQTHVSRGAAIHSLIMNGLGKCLIQPITSEPIIVITKDTGNRVLFPAGTQIPCDTVTIDDLATTEEGQARIELPICVGSPNKLLHNIVIEPPDGMSGFPVNTPVSVTAELNADKLLLISAKCMGIVRMVEPQNPFSNSEMTTEERLIFKAERKASLEARRNKGEPSREAFINLRRACEKAGKYLKAAETFEKQIEAYPDENSFNNIGVLYARAGRNDKAIEYYQRALEVSPRDPVVHCNLAMHLKYRDDCQYRKHIRAALEANPAHDVALIEAASIDEADGKHEEARAKLQRAYDIMMADWRAGELGDYGYSYLVRIATQLGHKDEAQKVRESQSGSHTEEYYDEDNLTRTLSKQLRKA